MPSDKAIELAKIIIDPDDADAHHEETILGRIEREEVAGYIDEFVSSHTRGLTFSDVLGAVMKLERTADGVPVTVGDVVWLDWHGHGIVSGVVSHSVDHDASDDGWYVWVSDMCDGTNDLCDCYSTHEAARLAQLNKESADAEQ